MPGSPGAARTPVSGWRQSDAETQSPRRGSLLDRLRRGLRGDPRSRGALDAVHRRRLYALDLVVPDGQPVRWGLNLLYRDGLPDRVCGPKLMLHVCRMAEAEGLSIGFYGNTQDVLDTLRRNLL